METVDLPVLSVLWLAHSNVAYVEINRGDHPARIPHQTELNTADTRYLNLAYLE